MPLINTRYISGPIDERVYDAAEGAGLPALVSSGYDGEATAWRWNVTPDGSSTLRTVVLRIGGPMPGHLFVEISVEVITPGLGLRQLQRHQVAHRFLPSAGALDSAWLTEQLAAAQDAALTPPGP